MLHVCVRVRRLWLELPCVRPGERTNTPTRRCQTQSSKKPPWQQFHFPPWNSLSRPSLTLQKWWSGTKIPSSVLLYDFDSLLSSCLILCIVSIVISTEAALRGRGGGAVSTCRATSQPLVIGDRTQTDLIHFSVLVCVFLHVIKKSLEFCWRATSFFWEGRSNALIARLSAVRDYFALLCLVAQVWKLL